jgi:hypothetical protein
MKVRLTIDLALPDELTDFSDGELSQFLFDVYTNFVVVQHLSEAVEWCARAKVGTDNEEPTAKRIFDYHRQAGKYTNPVTWRYERLDSESHD